MTQRFGKCVNFGNCTKADAKTQIPVAPGATDAVCPECGKPLVVGSPRSRGGISPIALGIVILIALAAAIGFSMILHSKSGGGPGKPQGTSSAASSAPEGGTASRAGDMVLCGSNTIGSQLGPDLVRAYLTASGASSVTNRSTSEDEQEVAGVVGGKTLVVNVAAHGSATAFIGLRSRTCQVGMASRRIKSGEAASLHALGNMLAPASEHVIGLDGIAVIVNQQNPVASLTVSQLRDIFTGKSTDWKAVGGTGGRIDVLARDNKSGTFDTFKTLVLDKSPLIGSSRRFEDSRTLSSAVSSNPNAIGFIGLPYVDQAKALRIASGGSPIAPTTLTVGRETYPLTRRLYLYTASSPTQLVGRFIQFVQSNAGQEVVNRDGFVGTVLAQEETRSSSRTLPVKAPARYRALVDGFDQASFNFYFNTGSSELDNKALVDVGRLVSLLSEPANRNKEVVLAGFADSTGDYQSNQLLSENRAQSAAKELEAEGIRVKDTVGFGQELPIRDNATEEGREKNRRVEIFITR